MSLGVGKRLTSPTVPMILAASIGLMAKIWVRVVPERSSPVASSSATTANDALWGSTPMSTFIMHAYLRFGRTSATIVAREGHSDFVLRTYLFRATPHAGYRRDASREQANPPCAGDRKLASDP